jgi:hypothetical protein
MINPPQVCLQIIINKNSAVSNNTEKQLKTNEIK